MFIWGKLPIPAIMENVKHLNTVGKYEYRLRQFLKLGLVVL